MSEKQRVLVVDDEPRNQRIITEILEDSVELKIASTGDEALKIIMTYLPDLVLLDIMMPGIDGYEVCRRIRANPDLSFTKVILVSGKAMLDERLKGYEVGADDYMTKPFATEELLVKAKVFLRLTFTERQLSQLNQSLDARVRETTKDLNDTIVKLSDSQQLLLQASKMSALGEMAGGVAHEINTPLGVLTLNSDIIEEALDAEEPQLDFIRNTNAINRGTIERISKIVKGLRNFSRDGSKDPLTSILVSKIIEETINLCQEKMKSHGVALKVSEIPIEAEILCRPIEISQVLLNLLNNAHDSVQELAEKWIRIEFEQNEKELCLTVTDSGPRIPADIQKKIFQPFFTTKEIGKGTGLGLSISTGIAFAHGGLLEYDDSCTNAKFILRLPRPSPKRLHSEGA